jgi:hypothetical protein
MSKTLSNTRIGDEVCPVLKYICMYVPIGYLNQNYVLLLNYEKKTPVMQDPISAADGVKMNEVWNSVLCRK